MAKNIAGLFSCSNNYIAFVTSYLLYREFSPQVELLCTIFFNCVIYFLLQMSAYFAPAFFCHLLGKCLKRSNPFLEVLKLGFVVIVTFSVVWLPYLHSSDAFLGVSNYMENHKRNSSVSIFLSIPFIII